MHVACIKRESKYALVDVLPEIFIKFSCECGVKEYFLALKFVSTASKRTVLFQIR